LNLPAQVPTQPENAAAAQDARPPIYDANADAKADIAAALDKAKRDNQRVLVMFGGNWCPWCHKLNDVFSKNREIARTLLYEYQLVRVDIGRWNKHMDIAKGYGADIESKGVPFLTVLDADGKVLANQETGALEDGDHHDPQKVAAFLDKWKAEPLDAEKLLAGAQTRAAADGKSVLLHLGAPWCPWCHKLEDFLARKDIAAVLAPDFIDLKIDVDRMTNGKQVAERIRGSNQGGIPWIAILDSHGEKLATSDGPQGNIGFPVEPPEIAHFLGMLKKTAKRISAEQLEQIEKSLGESAAEIKQQRSRRGGK